MAQQASISGWPDGTVSPRNYVLHPDRLKRLTTGQAAVIVPGQHTATIAQIFHDPTLVQEPRYDAELFDVDEGWVGSIDEGPSDAGAE